MTVDELLARLRGVRRSGHGWEAYCPAHEDQRRSLTVSVADSGALLLKCHAGSGCPVEQIVAALGHSMADLFPRQQGGGSPGDCRQIVATYDYRDEGGALLFQAVRYNPKGFSQRRPDGEVGWIHNLNGVRRVLYRLPELLAADRAEAVYAPEGEKDVDALRGLGLVATTNPGGAGKWRDNYNESLRGRHVVILPDNDDAGREHAEQLATSLAAIAASVRVLALPDLPPKGDVSDWFATGGTRETLEALVADAARRDREDGHAVPAAGVLLVPAAGIKAEPVTWAWRDRVPLGTVTLLVGDPGLGKSTLMIEQAARWSRGQLAGDLSGQPVTVALATAEDAIAQVVVPRLLAAGADLEHVVIVTVQRDGVTGGFVLPDDLAALRERMREAGARVLVVDPLVAHLPGDVNSHRDQDVRRALAPLARLAEETSAAVIAIVHLNKSQVNHVLGRVSGSVGFVAAARSVLLLGPDPDDAEGPTRVLAHAKSNLSPLAPALRLRIEERHVGDPPIRTSALVWCGEAQGVTASDLITPEAPEERSKRTEARDAILELLDRGPVEATAAEADLKRRDIATRTWKRAKRDLGVQSIKRGFPGQWYWTLPEGSHSPNMAPFDESAMKGAEKTPTNAEECHRPEECHVEKTDGGGTVGPGWEEGSI